MSALPQPSIAVPSPSQVKRQRRRQNYLARQQAARLQSQSAAGVRTSKVPRKKGLPVKIQVLLLLQKASLGITLTSLAASIGLYVASVNVPQRWSREYKQLETLQRQERQLIEINETLKYQLAQQAIDSNSQLNAVQPEESIFVPIAEVTTAKSPIDPNTEENLRRFKHVSLGY